MCCASPEPAMPAASSHARTAAAFSSVSRVEKLLLDTITSVVAGSRPGSRRASTEPSTLLTKCTRGPSATCRSASHTSRGPASLPPMPMLMTSVMRWPPAPRQAPERTATAKSRSRSRSAAHGLLHGGRRRRLVAGARTQRGMQRARCSVGLTSSPRTIAANAARTSASSGPALQEPPGRPRRGAAPTDRDAARTPRAQSLRGRRERRRQHGGSPSEQVREAATRFILAN